VGGWSTGRPKAPSSFTCEFRWLGGAGPGPFPGPLAAKRNDHLNQSDRDRLCRQYPRAPQRRPGPRPRPPPLGQSPCMGPPGWWGASSTQAAPATASGPERRAPVHGPWGWGRGGAGNRTWSRRGRVSPSRRLAADVHADLPGGACRRAYTRTFGPVQTGRPAAQPFWPDTSMARHGLNLARAGPEHVQGRAWAWPQARRASSARSF
jgi:hypothetical protein